MLAQSVNLRSVRPRPELGVKPTSRLNARTSHFDPERTSPLPSRGSTIALMLRAHRKVRPVLRLQPVLRPAPGLIRPIATLSSGGSGDL